MSALNDRFFNLGYMYGQGMFERQAERDKRRAAEEIMNQQGQGSANSNANSNTNGNTNGNTNTGSNITLGQLARNSAGRRTDYCDFGNDFYDNIYNNIPEITPALLAQNAAENKNYDFARDLGTWNSQSSNPYLRYGGYGTNQQGNAQADTAQASPYNAGADYGVDLNNPYSMAIMNAKNDYYRAQKLGDENAMLRAAQVAEQARTQAQEAGVPIQSFLSGNNTDYATALAMNDQLRQAQANGNKDFSYADLANGKMLAPQTTNPTQGLNEQQPTSAGTATATPAKGVTAPSVGNQQTAQTQTAPNTYDIQAGYNQMMNRMNGGSAQQNPFLGAGRRWGL